MVLGAVFMPGKTLNRLLQILAIATASAVLAVPAAEAQTRNKSVAKKGKSTVLVSRKAVKPVVKRRSVIRTVVPARPSFGQLAGLHTTTAGSALPMKYSISALWYAVFSGKNT